MNYANCQRPNWDVLIILRSLIAKIQPQCNLVINYDIEFSLQLIESSRMKLSTCASVCVGTRGRTLRAVPTFASYASMNEAVPFGFIRIYSIVIIYKSRYVLHIEMKRTESGISGWLGFLISPSSQCRLHISRMHSVQHITSAQWRCYHLAPLSFFIKPFLTSRVGKKLGVRAFNPPHP